jgi:predicted carbohydrate-binding protein with CBM5 and CBM33 domain
MKISIITRQTGRNKKVEREEKMLKTEKWKKEALIKRRKNGEIRFDYRTTRSHITDDVSDYIHYRGTSKFSYHVYNRLS